MIHTPHFIDLARIADDMSGLDTLIAKSIELTINENIGKQTYEKIENRIFEKHGIPISQTLQDFTKFDSFLREFFGNSATHLVSA